MSEWDVKRKHRVCKIQLKWFFVFATASKGRIGEWSGGESAFWHRQKATTHPSEFWISTTCIMISYLLQPMNDGKKRKATTRKTHTHRETHYFSIRCRCIFFAWEKSFVSRLRGKNVNENNTIFYCFSSFFLARMKCTKHTMNSTRSSDKREEKKTKRKQQRMMIAMLTTKTFGDRRHRLVFNLSTTTTKKRDLGT